MKPGINLFIVLFAGCSKQFLQCCHFKKRDYYYNNNYILQKMVVASSYV